MNGTIGFESQLGKGSTFTFVVVLGRDPAVPAADSELGFDVRNRSLHDPGGRLRPLHGAAQRPPAMVVPSVSMPNPTTSPMADTGRFCCAHCCCVIVDDWFGTCS
eukprot:TRINITY_DN15082_c0_g1_i1.p2 TRINITY_DN15082_c0_g1~~TRINITY_DN15082_c0_g1_i1.p2  ORF type:complete len:120 (+),score=11.51 TRINITY_DN15082_c0_g1_i1:48-362(+)